MRKIEQITKQELKDAGKSFEQVQDIFKDAQCELVVGTNRSIETYSRALNFAGKTDTGSDSCWTTIEGPNNTFMCIALDKADCLARLQGKTQAHQEQHQTQRAGA